MRKTYVGNACTRKRNLKIVSHKVRTTSPHKIPGTFAPEMGGKKEEVVRRGLICGGKRVEYEIREWRFKEKN